MFADLHMHTRFSDGSDDARSFIENIKKSGVTVFALTDHDTVDGIEAIRAKLSDCDAFEIQTVHGLGYKAVIK